MASDTSAREVYFNLWTGKLPITKLSVTIFQQNENDEKISLPCSLNHDKNIWQVTAAGLSSCQKLWYVYEFDIQQSNGNLVHVAEHYYRSFTPQNRHICDILTTYPGYSLTSDSNVILLGVHHYLQVLVKNLSKDGNSLQILLSDFEHMWQHRTDDFAPHQMKFIQDWADRQFYIYSTANNQDTVIAFLATAYGALFSNNEIGEHYIKLDVLYLEILRDKLASLSGKDLTEWSIPYVKQTGIVVLWSLQQLHWLMVVAYFGKLYDDIDELIDAKESVNKNKITVQTVQDAVIPRIINSYGAHTESTSKLSLEIPSSWGFQKDEKRQLTELVQMKFPSQKSSSNTTPQGAAKVTGSPEESEENFEIHFNLWTGSLPVTKVTVNISNDAHERITTLDCQHEAIGSGNNYIWRAMATGLQRDSKLWYRYEYEISDGNVNVTHTREPGRRKIRTNNKVLRDHLNFPIGRDESMCAYIFEGLMYYLQSIADEFQNTKSLKTLLYDVEHMWQYNKEIFTNENVNCILDWAENLLSLLSENTGDKLIFIMTVYGIMLPYLGEGIRRKSMSFLDDAQLRRMRSEVGALRREALTEWSIPHIKQTGLEVLWRLQQRHWLMVVAYLGKLYDDIDELLDAKESEASCNLSVVQIETIYNVVIPRILSNFGPNKEVTTKLLLEIPSAWRFTKEEKDQLAQVIQTNLPRQELGGDKIKREKQVDAFKVVDGELSKTSELSEENKVPTTFRVCIPIKDKKKIVTVILSLRTKQDKMQNRSTKRIQMKHFDKFESNKFKRSGLVATKDVYLPMNQDIHYQYAVQTGLLREWKSEKEWRSAAPPKTGYDIFQHRVEISHNASSCNTCTGGSFLHVRSMLTALTNDNLMKSLLEIDEIGFPGKLCIEQTFEDFFKDWLDNELTKIEHHDEQQKQQQSLHVWKKVMFLMVLLAKVKAKTTYKTQWFFEERKLTLLSGFMGQCSRDDIPSSMLEKEVEDIAIWIVEGLRGNWVFLWQYLSNLISVGRLRHLRDRVKPPDFSPAHGNKATHQLQSALSNLLNKPEYSEELMICVIGEIKDINTLVKLLQALSVEKFRPIMENFKVIQNVSKRFEELIQGHRKDLNMLTQLWKNVRRFQIQGVRLALRHCIHRYFKEETTWSPADANVHTLLLDRELYEGKKSFLQIMNIVLCVKSSCDKLYCSQQLFLKVIQESSILKLLEQQELKELIERGIQSISSCPCKCDKTHYKEKVEISLKIQHTISRSDYLKGDEVILTRANESIHKLLKRVPMDAILEFICKASATEWSDEQLGFLTGHVNDRLRREDKKEQSQILVKILRDSQASDKVTIRSLSVASILRKLLDIIAEEVFAGEQHHSIDEGWFPNFEANVLALIHYNEFLAMTFQVSDSSTYQFHDHIGLNAIASLLKRLPTNVSEGDVTIAFVDEILKRKNDVFLLIKSLPGGHLSGDQWTDICKSAKDTKDTYFKTRSFLQHLITYLADICQLAIVANAKEVSEKAQECVRDKAGKLLLSKTSCPEYWGCLHSLIPFATELRHLVYSVTFFNVCRSFFDGSIPDLDILLVGKVTTSKSTKLSHVSKGEGSNPITYNEFIDIICRQCLPVYRKYGFVVARCDLNVPVSIILNLTEGIDNIGNDLIDELSFLSKECGEEASSRMKEAIVSLMKIPTLCQRAQQLKSVFRTFDVTDDKKATFKALDTLIHLSDSESKHSLTLGQIHKAVRRLDEIEEKFTPKNCWPVIEQLTNCRKLIQFVRSVIQEDLRYLVDAVEERSDQSVNEQTVSALIDVKQFMTPLLGVTVATQAEELIEGIYKTIKNTLETETTESISTKINTCVNNLYNLEDLHKNVANRGEMTKEKIYNATTRGVFRFKMTSTDERCQAKLTYKREGKHVTYGLEELNDLHSRALLIGNSQIQTEVYDTESLSSRVRPELPKFVARVNAVNDIVKLCQRLTESGHFEFREFEASGKDNDSLEKIRDQLKRKLDDWQNDISEARKQFYFLNFFQSKQLGILDRFFNTDVEVFFELVLLFRFVNPTIEVNTSLRNHYKAPTGKKNPRNSLLQLGGALDNIYKNAVYPDRKIPGFEQSSGSRKDVNVTHGSVFVAELETGCSKVINVLLHLYQYTTCYLPEPSQIVFCHSGTSWEEVWLLLERCKAAVLQYPARNVLYCLVSVEQLPTETQFKLVEEVKKMNKDNKRFLLALICCSGHYHHIIDQFSPNYTHKLGGYSDSELRTCFNEGWPALDTGLADAALKQRGDLIASVTVLTSSQPGLGKSEYVKWVASSIQRVVSTLQVSGPFSKDGLVKMLQTLPKKKQCVLHIDASEMTERQMFDCFIFEIAVIGMAVSGTQICASLHQL
ncbi:uncharacterized protein [Amphiura filiformis]|uniref:uncharacterized protein n=1 Tax=Amphiura filiformis TaxID=82378 RepID=UPI003B224B03